MHDMVINPVAVNAVRMSGLTASGGQHLAIINTMRRCCVSLMTLLQTSLTKAESGVTCEFARR
jgi:hypothetical protein